MMRLVQILDYLDAVRIVRRGLFSVPQAVVTSRKVYLYQCDKCKRIVQTDGEERLDCCTPCRACGKTMGDAKHERPTPTLGTLTVFWPQWTIGKKRNLKKHWYAPERRAKKR